MLTQLKMQAGGMDSTVQATDLPKQPNKRKLCLYLNPILQDSFISFDYYLTQKVFAPLLGKHSVILQKVLKLSWDSLCAAGHKLPFGL